MQNLRQVGEWSSQPKTQKMPVNPLDKSTIVSIMKKSFTSIKATLDPGRFVIPSGTIDNPGILTIGPSSWWYRPDPDKLVEIPVASIALAESIVTDYANGLEGCNMVDAMPGLFFIPGEHSLDTIKKSYAAELNKAQARQKQWYLNLINAADVLWARTNGNPLSISEDARIAARELGMMDKPWLANFVNAANIKCKACGTFISGEVVVCPNCKVVINAEKFKSLGLQFAG